MYKYNEMRAKLPVVFTGKIKLTIENTDESQKNILKMPYKPSYIKKIKTIPSHRGTSNKKQRESPYSEETINCLKNIFKSADILKDSEQSIWESAEIALKEPEMGEYILKTIKSYLHCNNEFLKYNQKIVAEVIGDDIENYYLVKRKSVAVYTLNSAINALKFRYGTILKRHFIYEYMQ